VADAGPRRDLTLAGVDATNGDRASGADVSVEPGERGTAGWPPASIFAFITKARPGWASVLTAGTHFRLGVGPQGALVPGVIITFAGNGTASLKGDGVPAAAATLSPTSPALDGAGNLGVSMGTAMSSRRCSSDQTGISELWSLLFNRTIGIGES
jgi:hypothetical protein